MARIDFQGKKILLTGASTGIGRALAIEFAKRGAHLALTALPREAAGLKQLADRLRSSYGIQVWEFPVDLLESAAPRRLYEEVTRSTGEIDILVNNAGIAFYGPFHTRKVEEHLDTIHLNLAAPVELTWLFLPSMLERGRGMIINTSSVSALQPTPYHTVYGASKAGLQSFSEGLAAELIGTGVRVCTLNPTYTNTPILEKAGFPSKIPWFFISRVRDPKWVAQKAVRAFERGKTVYIPGIITAFIHLVLIRLTPRSILRVVSSLALRPMPGVKSCFKSRDELE